MTRTAASIVAVLLSLGAPRAYAQDSLVTVAGGLASTADERTSLLGGVATVDYHLSRRLSVVATVQRTTGTSGGYFSTWSWTDTFVGGGVRFSGRPWPRVEPFAHGLVGGIRIAGVERPDRIRPRGFVFVDGSYAKTVTAGIAGGGVSLYGTPRVGVRLGLDLYLQMFEGTLEVPQGRFTGELVVGIGSR